MTHIEPPGVLQLVPPERIWYELTRRVTERFFRMRNSIPPSLEPRLSKDYSAILTHLPPIGFATSREYDTRMEEWTSFHLRRIGETIPSQGSIDQRDRDHVEVMVQLQVLSHMIARLMTNASVDIHQPTQTVLPAGEFETINGMLMMLEEMTDHGRRDRDVIFSAEDWQRLLQILEGTSEEQKLETLQARFEEILPADRIYDRLALAYAMLPDQRGILSLRWDSSALDRLIAQ